MKHYLLSSFLLFLPSLLSAQQHKIDSALNIVRRHTKDSAEVQALNWLGGDAEKKDVRAALRYYREAIHVSETYAVGPWTGASYIRVALLLSRAAQHDSARLCIEKARHIVKRYPKRNLLLCAYYNVCGLHNKNIGNNEEALKFYDSLSALPETIINKEDVAGNYLNIANIYSRMNRLSPSQEYHFKALAIFEELKNETGIAFCYNGLGTLFYKQKSYRKAEDYLKRSLVLKKKIGNKKTIASGYNGLANVYMDLKEYPKALENINIAIVLFDEFKMKDHLCEGFINKGMICHFMGNETEAFEYFAKAKVLAEELQNANYLAKINVETGYLYIDQAKNNKALASLREGIKQAQQANNQEFEGAAHHRLAELYYSNGQFKEAFEEYRIFHALYDSSEGSAVKMKLYDLEAKHEMQKKESEIRLLKKDQQLQTAVLQQQQTLQVSTLLALALVVVISILFFTWYRTINRTRRKLEIEQMRNHIAQDLHDDIGSTLSSIKIISKMGAQNSAHERENENFLLIENYSGKMLSTMTDIIWSINPQNDTMDKIILHMKEFAAEILEPKNIDYHFSETGKLEKLPMEVMIRKNLFLIYKEAINNAAKYSHCTAIRIDLTLLPGKLTLRIHDNGEGFDVRKIKPGNGLKNMKERTTMMNGQFEIDAVNGGTEIVVTIPVTS